MFEVAHSNAEELIKADRKRSEKQKSEDIVFLNEQRTTDKAIFVSKNKEFKRRSVLEQEREERTIKRKMQEEARSIKEIERVNSQIQNVLEDLNDLTEEAETDDSDEDYVEESVSVPGPAKRKKKTDLITIQLPRNIIEATVKSATLAGVSVSQHQILIAGVIKAGGGNLDDFYLSHTYVRESRKKI